MRFFAERSVSVNFIKARILSIAYTDISLLLIVFLIKMNKFKYYFSVIYGT
jgi:hypothetical protein